MELIIKTKWHCYYSDSEHKILFYEKDNFGGNRYFLELKNLPKDAGKECLIALINKEVIADDERTKTIINSMKIQVQLKY